MGSWFRGKKIPGDFEIKKQVLNNCLNSKTSERKQNIFATKVIFFCIVIYIRGKT